MMLKNDDNLNCSRGWYTISMKISSLFVFCFLSIRSDKLGALSDPPDSIHLTAGSKYQDIKNNNKRLAFTIGKSSSEFRYFWLFSFVKIIFGFPGLESCHIRQAAATFPFINVLCLYPVFPACKDKQIMKCFASQHYLWASS